MAMLLGACASSPRVAPAGATRADRPEASVQPAGTARRGAYYRDDGPGLGPPADLSAVPEPVPRPEPLHPRANRPYVVFEREYVPMTALSAYRERGTATWYGRRYHGQRTSSGEVYDMYRMTAAHPTLPIPSYARVTHLASGRSVVVRVNDRGPFLHGRLIDLSYVAAERLGYVNAGSAEVEVELITRFEAGAPVDQTARPALQTAQAPAPAVVPPVAATRTPSAGAPPGAHYLQLAAFASRESAEASRERLAREVDGLADRLLVRQEGAMYKVHAGPFAGRDEALAYAQRIREATGERPFPVSR